MKCRARHAVYSERAHSSGNEALGTIAALEGEIVREAERDWRTLLGHWRHPDKYERQAIVAILTRAKERAKLWAHVEFDDKVTTESLNKFFDSFKPEDLIPAEGAS